MADIWGFAGGMIAGQQASDQHQLAQLSIQEGQLNLQSEGLKLKQAQFTFDRNQQMYEVMKQIGAKMSQRAASDGTPSNKGADQVQQAGSMTDKASQALEDFGTQLFEKGFFEEGLHAFEDEAKLQNSHAEMAMAHATVQKQAIQSFQARISAIDPNDPNAQRYFAEAVQASAKETGMPPPVDPNMKFDQNLKDRIRMIGETALQQAERQKNDAMAKKYQADADLDAQRAATEASRRNVNNARAEYWRKYGGPNSTKGWHPPTIPALRTEIATKIGAEFGVDPTDKDLANFVNDKGNQWAEEAQGILKDARANGKQMTVYDAVAQVVSEHKAGGDLAGIDKSSRVLEPGNTYEHPIPFNPKMKDAKQFQENHWYLSAAGIPMLWRDGKPHTQADLRREMLEQRRKHLEANANIVEDTPSSKDDQDSDIGPTRDIDFEPATEPK